MNGPQHHFPAANLAASNLNKCLLYKNVSGKVAVGTRPEDVEAAVRRSRLANVVGLTCFHPTLTDPSASFIVECANPRDAGAQAGVPVLLLVDGDLGGREYRSVAPDKRWVDANSDRIAVPQTTSTFTSATTSATTNTNSTSSSNTTTTTNNNNNRNSKGGPNRESAQAPAHKRRRSVTATTAHKQQQQQLEQHQQAPPQHQQAVAHDDGAVVVVSEDGEADVHAPSPSAVVAQQGLAMPPPAAPRRLQTPTACSSSTSAVAVVAPALTPSRSPAPPPPPPPPPPPQPPTATDSTSQLMNMMGFMAVTQLPPCCGRARPAAVDLVRQGQLAREARAAAEKIDIPMHRVEVALCHAKEQVTAAQMPMSAMGAGSVPPTEEAFVTLYMELKRAWMRTEMTRGVLRWCDNVVNQKKPASSVDNSNNSNKTSVGAAQNAPNKNATQHHNTSNNNHEDDYNNNNESPSSPPSSTSS